MYKRSKYSLYLSKVGRDFKDTIAEQARQQLPDNFECFKEKIRMTVVLKFADNRKHDIDNVKLLLDALNGVVYIDDSQIHTLHLTKEIGCGVNSITIIIE